MYIFHEKKIRYFFNYKCVMVIILLMFLFFPGKLGDEG